MKKLLIIVLVCWTYSYARAQNCTGNACSVTSIAQQANGTMSISNRGGSVVKVGVKWYYAQCQSISYVNVNPGQTLNFPFHSYCPPFTAENAAVPPPPVCNAYAKFVNPTGAAGPVYVYGIIVKPNSPAVDFCGSAMLLSTQPLNPGKSFNYPIPKGMVLIWNAFDVSNCDGDHQVAYGSLNSAVCCNGCPVNVH